jgi:type I restriction enzyme M protein
VTDSATFATPGADEDEETGEDLGDLLLEVLPGEGSTIGNQSAREALSRAAERQVGNTAK